MSGSAPAPPASPAPAAGASGLLELAVRRIAPDPDQPRTRFEESDIEALAARIRASSLLQPLIVTPNTTHPETGAEFLVLFGERRLRAAARAGRETVPAIVRTDPLPPVQRILLQIEENDERSPLSLYERARAYRRAVELSGLQPAEFARRNRMQPSTLSKYLALARAGGLLAEALAENRIHHLETARAFERLPQRYQQQVLANARKSGEPITISRVERAAAAADAEAEIEAEVEKAFERMAGTAAAPAARGDLPEDPPVRIDVPFSSLRALIRRLGAEPDASPDRARDQLLAILAREIPARDPD